MYSTRWLDKDQPQFFQEISQILKQNLCNCILCLVPGGSLSILHLVVRVTKKGMSVHTNEKDIAMINQSKKRISQSKDLFSSFGNIQSRSQFGGYSLSANGIMFALVSEGELYLRGNAENEKQFYLMGMESLIYHKRGIPISLRYFKVGKILWDDPDRLLQLAKSSLDGMLNDIKTRKNGEMRLKDLPNISLSLERLLWQVGISTSAELREQGSCATYLKLCSIKQNMGLNVLIALEGAILGFHEAALPHDARHSLTQWFISHQALVCSSAH